MNRPGPLAELLSRPRPAITAIDDPYSKVFHDAAAAVDIVKDGSVVMVGGFGGAGFPFALRDALAHARRKNITIICNNADFGELAFEGGLTRLICSYPTGPSAAPVRAGVEAGSIELLMTPQGTLAEQIRARGAGLGGVLTRTGVGTEFSERFEVQTRDGVEYLFIPPLSADVAFVRAAVADTFGNLSCRRASRNFNTIMSMAADHTVAEVDAIVPVGDLDPDLVHVPSPFVDRIVLTCSESEKDGN